MKAAVWYGGEDIRLEEITSPELGTHDVRIQVQWCGVCGTDVHIIRGEFPVWQPPTILGHEYSGVVVEIGSQVTTVAVGDRVTVDPSGAVCGSCEFCRGGQQHFCPQRRILRGAFAEYTVVPEKTVYTIPDRIDFQRAALIEPVSCAVHAVELAELRPGEKVLVLGGGPIGLLLTTILKHAGAAWVILSEPVAERRKLAEQMGADVTVDPRQENIETVVADYTGGLGPHTIFEAVGLPQTFAQAIDLARRGGKCVMVGMSPPTARVSIAPYTFFWKELKVLGSHMRLYNFRRTIDLLPVLNLAPLLSYEFRLGQVLEAIKAVETNSVLKPLVQPK